ncbi:hypothetical protein FDA33_17720 [Clostridium botulinum]|uniref:hypothetical protein n=1 Tax=Clostridium TaxID=1485 RepID=UPI0013F0859E|nr:MULTISPECIES: hypothetical protein [Clostridium]MCS6130431.1 hypothetical protein [Clostridium botulinum]NFH91998.1 hypothetical protein [Clostridium botulinum]NFI18956.1 hypothetical protein [Clostridium botulinum]NFL44784.1 hypothetical protein [Clostridium botulinum]NFL88829.1 hypothetical protein [Clostridium botulinum]
MENLIKRREVEPKEMNKAFMNDTKSSEILIIILKAHLYIERELIEMLTETIIDYKIISTSTFRQKLDLANSMGLVDGYYGVLGKVNSIRNGYAHNVNYRFGEKEFEDIISTLTKEDKDDFFNEYQFWKNFLYDGSIPEFNFKIQLLLSNIWFATVTCRLTAKKSIELRLKEKEIETLSKYITNEEKDCKDSDK